MGTARCARSSLRAGLGHVSHGNWTRLAKPHPHRVDIESNIAMSRRWTRADFVFVFNGEVYVIEKNRVGITGIAVTLDQRIFILNRYRRRMRRNPPILDLCMVTGRWFTTNMVEGTWKKG